MRACFLHQINPLKFLKFLLWFSKQPIFVYVACGLKRNLHRSVWSVRSSLSIILLESSLSLFMLDSPSSDGDLVTSLTLIQVYHTKTQRLFPQNNLIHFERAKYYLDCEVKLGNLHEHRIKCEFKIIILFLDSHLGVIPSSMGEARDLLLINITWQRCGAAWGAAPMTTWSYAAGVMDWFSCV